MTTELTPAQRAINMGCQVLVEGHWFPVRDGDPRLISLYRRHYSANPATTRDRQLRYGVSGVGQSMCVLTVTCDAAFIWVWNTTERYDKQTGVQCSFFRNEGRVLSSDLIREADALAWARWPKERRHWTYVSPSETRQKRDPGRCFLRAGWRYVGHLKKKKDCVRCAELERACGMSKGGLVILELTLEQITKSEAR